jgi:Alpha-L-arabinofuranosidase B (ABFB) domain
MLFSTSLGTTAVVDASSTAELKNSATFKVVRGLADANCYSFQSKTDANSYIRHANYRVRMNPNDGSPLFKSDATFCARAGLSGTGISLESKNYPGRFLRHTATKLWIAQSDGLYGFDSGTTFKEAVSWNVIAPWAQ